MSKEEAQVLIVDDNEELCQMLSHSLEREGISAQIAYEGETALKMIRSRMYEIMLLDLRMPGMDGMEVLRRTREIDQDLTVIMITAYVDTGNAVKAIKEGAYDFLAKPFDNDEMVRVVGRALADRELKRKLRYMATQVSDVGPLKEMMGPSDAVARVTMEVKRVAQSDFSVIIMGETGSGKELVARAIHNASNRSNGPFIPVDCGAIPETLLESELFGHEKGAFTSAATQKLGKFELANGGTIFLDEITNMPMGSQAKLLRFLQDKKIYRVGSIKAINVNVRLLAATNQVLHELSLSDSFRRDLFYRLNEYSITIPPLRERKEDIPYLAKRFLDMASVELNKGCKGFSESALEVLLNYTWPGNVRQFRSAIRRALLMADDLITEKHLDLRMVPLPGLAFISKVQRVPWENLSLREILQESIKAIEREVLFQALKNTGGNKAKAARLLKIDYKTMHTKVKKLGISINGGDHGQKKDG